MPLINDFSGIEILLLYCLKSSSSHSRTLNSPELSEVQVLKKSLKNIRWDTVTACEDECTCNESSTTSLSYMLTDRSKDQTLK